MADGGYDVSGFRGIHPMFGTLEGGLLPPDATDSFRP